MRVFYHPDYYIPLPERHPFPMGKYPALLDALLAEGLVRPGEVGAPDEIAWSDLGLVHTPSYLADLEYGTLPREAERRLGLPWSPALVRRSRLAVAGTLLSCRAALEDGVAANLAGGTHHAFPDHGEGFCTFNDVAVALRKLLGEGAIARALVVDLDVHQGNGTAAIFAGDPRVFTFSVHGARNFPFRKQRSDCDVELPDGADDACYLAALEAHLGPVFAAARPELVIYLAGVDPVVGDRYGRMALTRAGLAARDRRVLSEAYAREVPLALVLGGGYARSAEETAGLHAIAHREARAIYV